MPQLSRGILRRPDPGDATAHALDDDCRPIIENPVYRPPHGLILRRSREAGFDVAVRVPIGTPEPNRNVSAAVTHHAQAKDAIGTSMFLDDRVAILGHARASRGRGVHRPACDLRPRARAQGSLGKLL